MAALQIIAAMVAGDSNVLLSASSTPPSHWQSQWHPGIPTPMEAAVNSQAA
jgi:hypothetical protein